MLEDVLRRWLDAGAGRAHSLGPDVHEKWSALGRCLAAGKRVRPELLLPAHRCHGRTDHDVVVQVAAAPELLHTASARDAGLPPARVRQLSVLGDQLLESAA